MHHISSTPAPISTPPKESPELPTSALLEVLAFFSPRLQAVIDPYTISDGIYLTTQMLAGRIFSSIEGEISGL